MPWRPRYPLTPMRCALRRGPNCRRPLRVGAYCSRASRRRVARRAALWRPRFRQVAALRTQTADGEPVDDPEHVERVVRSRWMGFFAKRATCAEARAELSCSAPVFPPENLWELVTLRPPSVAPCSHCFLPAQQVTSVALRRAALKTSKALSLLLQALSMSPENKCHVCFLEARSGCIFALHGIGCRRQPLALALASLEEIPGVASRSGRGAA